MKRIAPLAWVALVAVGAPAFADKPRPFEAAAEGHFDGDQGTVVVTFGTGLSGVEVSLHGIDGLVVTGPAGLRAGSPPAVVVRREAVESGERVPVPVQLTRGEGRSSLVVSVSAEGRGGFVVTTFAFGEESAAQREQNARGVKVDSRGQAIHVMTNDAVETITGLVEPAPGGVAIVQSPESRSRVSFAVRGAAAASIARLEGQTVQARGRAKRTSKFAGELEVESFGVPRLDLARCGRGAKPSWERAALAIALRHDGQALVTTSCEPIEVRADRFAGPQGGLPAVEVRGADGKVLHRQGLDSSQSLLCQWSEVPPGPAGSDTHFSQVSSAPTPQAPTTVRFEIPLFADARSAVWLDVPCGGTAAEQVALELGR